MMKLGFSFAVATLVVAVKYRAAKENGTWPSTSATYASKSVADSSVVTSESTLPAVVAPTAVSVPVPVPKPADSLSEPPFTVLPVGGAPLHMGTPYGDPNSATPYTSDCPAGFVATGVVGTSALSLTSLALSCQPMNAKGDIASGDPVRSPTAGGGGGESFTVSCPSGSVLIGLTGRIGNGGGGLGTGLNDMIAGICRSLTVPNANVTTASVGSNNRGSIAYTSMCPDGLVVTGLDGRAKPSINQTRIRCR